MTVSDAFKEFLLSRKYSGLLAKTIDSYKNLIHRFVVLSVLILICRV